MAVGESESLKDKFGFSLISQKDVRVINNLVLNRRENLIFNILSELGLTISELTELKVSQIFLDKKIVSLKNRDVSFSEILYKKIVGYIDEFSPINYLFYTRQSPQITPRRVQQLLKKISSKINKKITPSILRRYAISEKLNSGISIKEVKDFSGLKRIDKKDYLTKSEFEIFINSISSKRDRLIANLFYELGLTLSQVSYLKISDVDLKKKIISIMPDSRTSLNVKRQITISKNLISELRNFISSSFSKQHLSSSLFSKYLFATRQSVKLSERRIQQTLQKYSEKLFSDIGKEITSSVLRNSFIVNRISEVGLKQTSMELGMNEFRIYEYGQLGFATSSDINSESNIKKNLGGEHARKR